MLGNSISCVLPKQNSDITKLTLNPYGRSGAC